MNPIATAIQGKGIKKFVERGANIAQHYGLAPTKMQNALTQLIEILDRFQVSGTFPITAAALQRHPQAIQRYQAHGIEFAVHGYYHCDHSQLSLNEQLAQLATSRNIFQSAGVPPTGFRSPYLRWNLDTLAVLQEQQFMYDSSQGMAWDVVNGNATPAYEHVLEFYGALSAERFPSVPSKWGSLVRIPYTLPDDEALVERLKLTPAAMCEVWHHILRRTYALGELFTLGLHPERTALCLAALTETLTEARALRPAVWIARLNEIAAWWHARAQTNIVIADTAPDEFHFRIAGPATLTVLARNIAVCAETQAWFGADAQVNAFDFIVRAPQRPVIGLAPQASPKLKEFLWQQGYIVETGTPNKNYAHYFDHPVFNNEQARAVLAQIENTQKPLVRLSRWPERARSALSITGDIDALTLWDYGLRLIGR